MKSVYRRSFFVVLGGLLSLIHPRKLFDCFQWLFPIFRWNIPLVVLFSSSILFGVSSLPPLTPEKVQKKTALLLKEHVSIRRVDQTLMRKVLERFVDYLDGGKLYFLKEEIELYANPSSETTEKALLEYRQGVFSLFEEVYDRFLLAVERQRKWRKKLWEDRETERVEIDWQELDWAESAQDLKNRLMAYRKIQESIASRMGEGSWEKWLQLFENRLFKREEKFLSQDVQEKKRQCLVWFLKAFASSLDHHTTYFTPSEVQQLMIHIEQKLSGIGVELREDIDGLKVHRLLEKGPAFKSKQLAIGDRIVAVDGEPILGMDLEEAVEKIRGRKGTVVQLALLKQSEEREEGEKIEVTLMREEVSLEDSRASAETIPYGNGVIGVISLFAFYQDRESSSAEDIRIKIQEMQEKHHLLGIILDLRGNGGGLLSQAIEVCNLFLRKGVVVSLKANQGKMIHYRNYLGNPIWEGPLLVLTNRGTASCGEIVAQALQDYKRAILVGDATTWGKGSYQSFTLYKGGNECPAIDAEGEFKITQGLYYTVSGKSPQLKGVAVDIEVPGHLSTLKIGERWESSPLEADRIAPSFQDQLADLPFLQRWKVQKMYQFGRQYPLVCYHRHLEQMKKNSILRIQRNKNYQYFLQQMEGVEETSKKLYGENDLQLEETCHVMKDLIYLLEKEKISSPYREHK